MTLSNDPKFQLAARKLFACRQSDEEEFIEAAGELFSVALDCMWAEIMKQAIDTARQGGVL